MTLLRVTTWITSWCLRPNSPERKSLPLSRTAQNKPPQSRRPQDMDLVSFYLHAEGLDHARDPVDEC